jgi:acyl-CoA thioester hydrolase
MPAVFEHPHVVRADEIDGLGHANNIAYVAWMQSAALAHSAAQGWPTEAYKELGAGWVVRRHEIDYLRPALAGERLVIRTWVASAHKVSSLRRFEIRRLDDDQILAKAATQWAFIDYTKGTPRRVPPEVAAAFDIVPDG